MLVFPTVLLTYFLTSGIAMAALEVIFGFGLRIRPKPYLPKYWIEWVFIQSFEIGTLKALYKHGKAKRYYLKTGFQLCSYLLRCKMFR